MRWPWQRAPVRDEGTDARFEQQEARHRKVLRGARRVLSVASDDIEKLIVDDYARAEEQRVGRRAKQ